MGDPMWWMKGSMLMGWANDMVCKHIISACDAPIRVNFVPIFERHGLYV